MVCYIRDYGLSERYLQDGNLLSLLELGGIVNFVTFCINAGNVDLDSSQIAIVQVFKESSVKSRHTVPFETLQPTKRSAKNDWCIRVAETIEEHISTRKSFHWRDLL